MPSSLPKKVLLTTLCEKRTFATIGQVSPNSVIAWLDIGPIERMGPMVEKFRVHWAGEGFTNYFQARVIMQWSTTGEIWNPAPEAQLIAYQNADGEVIGSYYTTDSNFGLRLRMGMECENESGSLVESGSITAVLETVLKS